MARNAQADGRDARPQGRERGHLVQRPRHPRCADQAVSARLRHERPFDHDVVAARAAHAGRVPVLFDSPVAAWQDPYQRLHPSVRCAPRVSAVFHKESGHEPTALLTAAAIRPATREDVAAFGLHSLAADRQRRRTDHPRVAEHLARRFLAQSGRCPPVAGADHHVPGRRTVRHRQLFHHPHAFDEVEFLAPELARHAHLKESCIDKRFDQRLRQLPPGLSLVGVLSNRWRQVTRRANQP